MLLLLQQCSGQGQEAQAGDRRTRNTEMKLLLIAGIANTLWFIEALDGYVPPPLAERGERWWREKVK